MRPAAELLVTLFLAPSRVYPENEVQVYGVNHKRFECDWYALCTRPATGVIAHPMVGQVFVCESCINRHQMAHKVSDWLVYA